MQATHPFSRSEIRSLVLVHGALLAVAAGLGCLAAVLNARNRGIGPGVIPAYATYVGYLNVFLPLAALIASRAFLKARLSLACRRLRDRQIHIEAFKRRIRTAYLLRAAMTEVPALLGLAAAILIALGPGDIFAAPAVHLAHFQGVLLFVAETLRVTPTASRMERILTAEYPD